MAESTHQGDKLSLDAIRYSCQDIEPRRALAEGEESDDDPTGGVMWVDLFGNGRHSRDNLPWHLRPGAWKASEPRVRTEFSDDVRRRRLAAIHPNWK